MKSILENEKYKGDAILQKTFTVDFLSKKTKVNEGEIPQYYVENSHPAIIEPEVFNMVQQEMKRRKKARNRYSGNSIFASRIICGECGSFYGSKVWHKCKTPHLDEDTIKELFVEAVNRLLSDRGKILAGLKIAEQSLFDTSAFGEERKELKSEMAVVAEMIQRMIDENARVPQSQEKYRLRYEGLVNRFETAKERLEEITNQRELAQARRNEIKAFIKSLGEQRNLILESKFKCPF